MTEDAYAEKMKALRLQYLKTLPEHARVLNEHWRRLRHVSWEAQSVQAMYQAAHKLAGSGATFGFSDITDKGRALEQLLVPMIETGEVAAPARREAIHNALKALISAMEAALRGRRPAEPAAPVAAVPGAAARGARIALVEDDEMVAGQLRLWLEEAGYDAIWFTTPEDFEQSLSQGHVDLLLLDVSFPDAPLGGVDWLVAVRDRLGQRLPVVMLSARTDMTSRLRAMRAGAASYLPKPVAREDLVSRVHSLLEHREADRPRVLLVDDDVALCSWITTVLDEQGFSVRALNQPLGILDALERARPDVLVLDYQMPGINGVEVARLLRQDPRYLDIPILFVSGDPEALSRQHDFSIVGNAFLSKPLDPVQLGMSLRNLQQQARQVSSRIRMASARQRPEGLQNRAFFLSALNEALGAQRLASGSGSGSGELLLHLVVHNSDYLRQRHGVLGAASIHDRIEQALAGRPEVEGRGCIWGEFTYLLRLSLPEGELAEEYAETLRQALQSKDFVGGEGQSAEFSVGGVVLDGSHASVEQLLRTAEKACAEALRDKSTGTVLAATDRTAARKPADDALRQAIKARNYRLMFQPIVNLESNEPLFEASLRLEDAAGNSYLPAQFLEFVERYAEGGLTGLDRWVIERTVQEMTQLRGKEAESWAVVIRLSPTDETLDKLLPFIANVVQNSRLKGSRRVYFSLPESFVMRQPARVATLFEHLRKMNCGVMIDEVAGGSSTEGLMSEMPAPDMIKLAVEWNQHIRQRDQAGPVLARLASYVGGTDNLVAAGIEDTQLFASFWDAGIRNFQGFFIQEPSEALAWEAH
ncbi:response regulator [Isoalcanivorax indicus]|uniref:response regulator n=1 Tax=Isoalcanivorax indicus TaxID=2202653 RepID=UPI000DBAACBB|nr:response regulator [Isoalcanivorax indicus]